METILDLLEGGQYYDYACKYSEGEAGKWTVMGDESLKKC